MLSYEVTDLIKRGLGGLAAGAKQKRGEILAAVVEDKHMRFERLKEVAALGDYIEALRELRSTWVTEQSSDVRDTATTHRAKAAEEALNKLLGGAE